MLWLDMQMLQLWRTAADKYLRYAKFDLVTCRLFTSFDAPLLPGIVLDRVNPQDVGGPLSLGLVLMSSSANCCRQLVKHQYLPACRGLSLAIVSSLTVLCFLMSNRKDLLQNASYMPLRWWSCMLVEDAGNH